MCPRLRSLFIVAALSLIAPAQTSASEPWDETCRAVDKADFPATDKPTPVQASAVKGHSSMSYYYGIGVAKDYEKARHAAFVELAADEQAIFGDATILAMLYANGFGVKRDLDLATKLACTFGHAPMEIEGRVARLQALKTKHETHPFDICDDITSGFMMGACEGRNQELKDVVRDKKLDKLTESWPVEHKRALVPLKRAAQEFWKAHSDGEVDLSGTARAMLMIQEEAALNRSFLNTLAKLEKRKFPQHTVEQLRAADAALNREYQRALKADLSFNMIAADGIRAAERKWLVYRDAWVTFAALRYPSVAAESWKTWLTRERTKQLKELSEL